MRRRVVVQIPNKHICACLDQTITSCEYHRNHSEQLTTPSLGCFSSVGFIHSFHSYRLEATRVEALPPVDLLFVVKTAHFGINLRCVQDIQVMEFATRRFSGKFVKGLAKCIEEDGGLGNAELRLRRFIKDEGCRLFLPDKGGSYDVFLERPLSNAILKYCAQDVTLLPNLWKAYSARLTPEWSSRVQDECLARIKLSQSETFVSDGRHMANGPWSPAERQVIL